MARKPTEGEPRCETISYRITGSLYNKVVEQVEKSHDADLSEYARNALIKRINEEDKIENATEA